MAGRSTGEHHACCPGCDTSNACCMQSMCLVVTPGPEAERHWLSNTVLSHCHSRLHINVQALWAGYRNDPTAQLRHLLAAHQWAAAHALFTHKVAPALFLGATRANGSPNHDPTAT